MSFNILIPTDCYPTARMYLSEKNYHLIDFRSDASVSDRALLLTEADGIIARTEAYSKELLDCATKLKVIARAGVGCDNLPIPYCTKRGIQITNTPEANYVPVAEHTIGLILALAHRICNGNTAVHSGNWTFRQTQRGCEMSGKTLGIIGFGRIGHELAKIAHRGFEMNILCYDAFLPPDRFPAEYESAKSINEILERADFVSLHLPLTAETLHMVDASFFQKMRRSAFLINCSRGGIVDEQALYTALSEHIIAGAGIDVMEHEPPSADHPLFSLDNLIVTPHFAALNTETMDRMGLHAAHCIDAVLSGRAPCWPINQLPIDEPHSDGKEFYP